MAKFINESEMFNEMEDCPFVYLVIIPRLMKLGQKEAKKDQIMKDAIKATEKVLKKIDSKQLKALKEGFNMFSILEMFKMSNNYKVLFKNYFGEFKSFMCNQVKTFKEVLEYENMFDELYNCEAYEVLKNNI